MNNAKAIVLSPHRDDAAFSCGLLLSELATVSAVTHIINVCTISDYAPYANLDDALDRATQITHLRAQEDLAFLHDLQATTPAPSIDLIDLGWKDAPLRRTMAVDDVLSPVLLPSHEVEALAVDFRKLPGASIVVAPLALGGHIDHRLVHRAAIAAWHSDTLIFYEDLPYAARLTEPTRDNTIQKALPWSCVRYNTAVGPSGIKRRLALHYPSQIAASVADEIETYTAACENTERLYGSPIACQHLAHLLAAAPASEDKRQ